MEEVGCSGRSEAGIKTGAAAAARLAYQHRGEPEERRTCGSRAGEAGREGGSQPEQGTPGL